jgi:nitrogenase-stabilizing/protective protein
MPVSDALARLERAEQYFDLLGLAYDPRVLAVYRLRLLKRFGMAVADIEERRLPADDVERRRLYAEALRSAHDAFARRAASEAPAAAGELAACGGCHCG